MYGCALYILSGSVKIQCHVYCLWVHVLRTYIHGFCSAVRSTLTCHDMFTLHWISVSTAIRLPSAPKKLHVTVSFTRLKTMCTNKEAVTPLDESNSVVALIHLFHLGRPLLQCCGGGRVSGSYVNQCRGGLHCELRTLSLYSLVLEEALEASCCNGYCNHIPVPSRSIAATVGCGTFHFSRLLWAVSANSILATLRVGSFSLLLFDLHAFCFFFLS